jgi:hypothetical protein
MEIVLVSVAVIEHIDPAISKVVVLLVRVRRTSLVGSRDRGGVVRTAADPLFTFLQD